LPISCIHTYKCTCLHHITYSGGYGDDPVSPLPDGDGDDGDDPVSPPLDGDDPVTPLPDGDGDDPITPLPDDDGDDLLDFA
jgi:hypothetical protein